MEKTKKGHVSATVTSSICNTIVVGIDGSEGSHNAVEIVIKDYHRKGLDKIILVHISNAKKEHEKGVQYHSKNIYNHYHAFMAELLGETDYEIIFEDRKEETTNVFEQINGIANAKNADLLVLGFRGYKGSKNRPDELSKSVTYLVHKPLIPVLIIKEKTHREYRTENGFKYLICIESAESKSFKAFTHVLRYINAETDIIHGFTIDSGNGNATTIEKLFKEVCAKNDIVNFEFTSVPLVEEKCIKSTIIGWIEEHLKNENHFIDFIVLGYNPQKYNFNKEAPNTTVDLIKSCNVNVFFDH